MADRDCEHCKHYKIQDCSGIVTYGCSKWKCEFEQIEKGYKEGLYTEVTVKKYSHDMNGNVESVDEITYYIEEEDDYILEHVIQKYAIIDGI